MHAHTWTELETETEEKAEVKIPLLWINPDLPELALIAFYESIVRFIWVTSGYYTENVGS